MEDFFNEEPVGIFTHSDKILVADDDLFIRSLIHNIAGPYVDVDVLECGNKVVEKYLEIKPAVLFLDIHLPGRNGFSIVSDILRYDPKAHVIIMSGDSTRENVVRSKQSGAKAFLTKPFHKDRLISLIQRSPYLKHKYV